MMESMEICKEKHKFINDKLGLTERRLNNHGDRLDKLEQNSVRLEERLDHLIKQLSSLNSIMRWFIALLVTSFVGFFFYVIQNRLFP